MRSERLIAKSVQDVAKANIRRGKPIAKDIIPDFSPSARSRCVDRATVARKSSKPLEQSNTLCSNVRLGVGLMRRFLLAIIALLAAADALAADPKTTPTRDEAPM